MFPWLNALNFGGIDPALALIKPSEWFEPLKLVAESKGLNFKASNETLGALAYERRVCSGEIPTRECLHDWFNAVVWLNFPSTKQAISNLHIGQGEGDALDVAKLGALAGNGRSRQRDALTLFDESGIVLLTCQRELSEGLRNHQWQRVLVEKRQNWLNNTRLIVFGHGLLEAMLNPYKGLCGKVLHLILTEQQWAQWGSAKTQTEARQAELDGYLSELVGHLDAPAHLSPLPVMGVPGWFDCNKSTDFYDDKAVFREKPTPKSKKNN